MQYMLSNFRKIFWVVKDEVHFILSLCIVKGNELFSAAHTTERFNMTSESSDFETMDIVEGLDVLESFGVEVKCI